jgi:tetratricopeptide (TPR) repeat protein
MFYILNTPYSKTIEQLSGAVENSGDDLEYIVFAPYANIVVYNFEKELMTKEEARAIYERLNAVADLKIAKGDRLSDSYQQAKQSMNSTFSKIERYIFDCEFFKAKLRPEYDADPDNFEVIKQTLAILKGQGCGSGDVFFDELDTKWKKYAAVENAKIQADFEQNNPNVAAKRLYDQGDFKSAALKYQEAADGEVDPAKKAGYLFSLASIEFRKLKQYSKARATAREAAKLRPGWGRPFMLIGDMYGSTARSCGDSWNQRLAILAAMDKYNYAKSIDSEQAKDANSRLSKYRASMPDKNDGFMRGIKVGHAASVGCWIGETVKVRFSN